MSARSRTRTSVPTPGDDPYRTGQAVALSSDENTEVEIIGGGSNAWNSGDFLHYLYQSTPLTGDFDVAVAVDRYDRSANQGGYSNSGLMLRASPYLSGQEYTAEGTKVPMVANVTYLENSSPGRGAIPLWRTDAGGGYGNGAAGYSWDDADRRHQGLLRSPASHRCPRHPRSGILAQLRPLAARETGRQQVRLLRVLGRSDVG
jgi:hypothetical protein